MQKGSSQFSVLSSQFSVLSSQFSVLSSQFSVLSSQFSVLSSQLGELWGRGLLWELQFCWVPRVFFSDRVLAQRRSRCVAGSSAMLADRREARTAQESAT